MGFAVHSIGSMGYSTHILVHIQGWGEGERSFQLSHIPIYVIEDGSQPDLD